MEIERKFLLKEFPDLSGTRVIAEKKIEQYYAGITDEEELRIRSINDSVFKLTFKSGRNMVRDETNQEISKQLFERIKDKCSDSRIRKTRTIVESGDVLIAIDSYKDDELYIAEIEFGTMKEAIQYNDIPTWLNVEKEVTTDERYKNRNFSLQGVPKQ